MSVTVPNLRPAVWAESGDTTAPSTGEQQSGYVAGKPSRRKSNWFFNWLDNATQYLLKRGLPAYNASQTYDTGDRVQYSNVGYTCLADGTSGVTPGTDGTKWAVWGHTDAQVNTLIDTKLGTLSGSVSGVSPSGSSLVNYIRQLCGPNTTDKTVACRLNLHHEVSGWSTTLTLSGAAAFGTGADGAQATIADSQGNTTATDPVIVRAKVLSPTTVQVSVTGFTGSDDIIMDVVIRGH